MKGIRILLASIRKADKDFNLINNNDKIVVGISGGKDSMALLYSLHLYKKFSKSYFEIIPCMINLGFENFDPTPISNYCEHLGYKLEILNEPQVFQILKMQKEKQCLTHLPCSICSRMKKAIINKFANNIKANKVSFAHHKDDAIETLFLNEIYGGRIATFSPKMHLSNEDLTFIRPFIYVKEKDILKTIKEENIPTLGILCPNDKKTQREEIKFILKDIYKKYPQSENNFLTMLFNKEKEDIFYMHEEHKIEGSDLYYKLVREKNDFIRFKLFNKDNVNEEDLLTSNFLIYNKNELVGTCSLKRLEERKFSLNSLNIQEEFKELFLNDLKKELFDRFNPYIFLD